MSQPYPVPIPLPQPKSRSLSDSRGIPDTLTNQFFNGKLIFWLGVVARSYCIVTFIWRGSDNKVLWSNFGLGILVRPRHYKKDVSHLRCFPQQIKVFICMFSRINFSFKDIGIAGFWNGIPSLFRYRPALEYRPVTDFYGIPAEGY